MKRVLIIAGTYAQGREYARRRGLTPANFAIVASMDRVMGLRPDDFELALVGTWGDNEAVDYFRSHPLWLDAWRAAVSES